MNGSSILFSLSFALNVATIFCQVHYIVPTQSDCMVDSCLTFSQFAENYVANFTYSSNTTLLIIGKNHILNNSISVLNAVEFSMSSVNDTELNPGSVTITCSEHASFIFRNVSTVLFRGLMFVGCSNNRIELVHRLILDQSTFQGLAGSKTSLTLVNTMALITSTNFIANTVGTLSSNLNPSMSWINNPVSLDGSTTLGGALIVSSSDVIFDNCSFEDNEASIGGAIYSELESNITIRNSVFSSNTATRYGGALAIRQGSTLTTKSTILRHNNVQDSAGCGGGALYTESNSTVSIDNTTFIGNSATSSNGGGIYVQIESSVLVYNCTFTKNTAAKGGVIYARNNTSIAISNSTVSQCRASSNGGVVFLAETSTTTICSSHFYDNSARFGGIISTDEARNSFYNINGSNIFVHDSHFESNLASTNGGVFNIDYFTTSRVYNSTFANNRATNAGGVFTAKHNSSIIITKSQFEDNNATVGAVIYAQKGINITIYSCYFINNSAENGGANYVRENSILTIDNGTFINNIASGAGGSLYALMECVLIITNSNFSSNTAVSGGVLFINRNSSAIFTDWSLFLNNTAAFGEVMFTTSYTGIVNETDSDTFNNNSTNCYFEYNHATSDGGVMFLEAFSSLEIYKGNFYSNTAEKRGGVFYAKNQVLITIDTSSFDGNHAGMNGGVISGDNMTSISTHSSNFSNNRAFVSGGVSSISVGSVIVMNWSLFSNNSAEADGGVHYAMEGTNITTHSCEFNGNSAKKTGGVFYAQKQALVTIERSCFNNSTVDRYGGVVHLEESNTMAIYNSTFNDNCARINGGVISGYVMASISVYSSNFSNNRAEISGGVSSISAGSVIELKLSQFSNNTAGIDAGVHYAVEGTDTLLDTCKFHQNSADYGGVLNALRNNSITIYDSTFSSNIARTDGGTLYGHTMCSFSIFDSCFFDNTAKSNGVMLASDQSSIEINSSIFTNNIAGNIGGVVYVYDYSHIIVRNSTFNSNKANDSGGIVYGRKNSRITFIECYEFLNNSAENAGGVVYVQQGSNLTIEFSYFSSNTADYGGIACISVQCHVNIMNSTFSDNRGNVEGGVIAAYKRSIVAIESSTFTSNTATYGGVTHAYDNSHLQFDGNMYKNNSAYLGGVNRIFQNSTAMFIGGTFESNCGTYGGVLYTKNGEVVIENCSLSSNHAEYRGGAIYAEHSVITITNNIISNSTAKDDGGVIALYDNSDVSVIACKFSNNSAQRNGGVIEVQLLSKMNVTDSTFRFSKARGYGGVIHARYESIIYINCCTFTENSADTSGGAIDISLISSFIIANSSFINNSAQLGGAISLQNSQTNTIFETAFQINNAQAVGGAIIASTLSKVNIMQCNFTQNTAKIGAALTALQNSTIVIASPNPKENEMQMISSTQIQNNKGEDYGGGIYLSGSDISFNATTILIENQVNGSGGGIYATNSSIIVRSTLTFKSNQAHSGGGISMSSSKLHFKTNEGIKPYAHFLSNHANFGGGIHVDDKGERNLCYSYNANESECFFESEDNFVMGFTDNYANTAGSNLYGGLLDRCKLASGTNHSVSGATGFIGISNITNVYSISSDPVKVCYCYNNGTNCDQQKHNIIQIMRGEELNVSIIAVNQVGHPVNATVQSRFRHLILSNSQTIQTIGAECSLLHYHVSFPRESPRDELIVNANGSCNNAEISKLNITIEVLKCVCGYGFIPANNTNTCTCDCDKDEHFVKYIQTCNYSTKSVIRKGTFWIQRPIDPDHDGSSPYLIYPYCPLDYCKSPSIEVSVNLNTPNGSDAQCANHRGGLLCGRCLPNYCLSLGSSKCLDFPDEWIGLVLGILVSAALGGIILVVLILFLNLTVAVGTLNSIIFYANIINAHKTTYFDQSSKVFAPVSVLMSWLNLDIGIDLCFFEEMDTYSKTWLQLAFPTYIMFLVIIIIWISSCSTKFSTLLGKRNPVATLATLILLSYTTFLQTTITAFSLVPNHTKAVLWLPDPTVEYGHGKHIALICVSILILFFGTLYTLLITFWQCLIRSPRYRVLKWTRNQKLHSFIGTYHTPHNAKHRYWTGLLLFVRVIVYLISAFTTSIDPRIALLITALSVCSLLLLKTMLIIRVYKNWLLNSMESFAYFNIAMLSLFTWYTYDDQTKANLQKVAAYISVGATLVQLVLIIIYHTYRYSSAQVYIYINEKILASNVINKIMLRRRTSNDQSSDHLQSAESVLLDAIDSPRVKYALPIPKVQEEPTSSTVSMTSYDHEETHEDIPKKETASREKPRSQTSIAKSSLLALTQSHLTRKSEPKVFTFPSQEIDMNMRKPLLEKEEISEV